MKAIEELEINLSQAGIALYYEDGTIKDTNRIMDELAQIISVLPPELVGAIIANLSGLRMEDSEFLNR